MFDPVVKKSLGAQVFEQLRDRIVTGELEPGDALPAERVLSDLLGVNRGAVREGLKRLEQAGLVSTQHGGGTTVLDYQRTGGLELLASLIVQGGRVNTRIVRSVLELRQSLAPDVARLAARRATPAQAGRIAGIVEQMIVTESTAELQQLALDYWAAVVDCTGNLAYRLAFNSLDATYGQVQEHLTRLLAPEIRAIEDYQQLSEAIASRDEPAAARAAIEIVQRGTNAVLSVLTAVDEAQR